MVWHFIGVYIINRTLHDRLEIRNFSCVEKYFSTLEEKFRISARPCNILYLFYFLQQYFQNQQLLQKRYFLMPQQKQKIKSLLINVTVGLTSGFPKRSLVSLYSIVVRACLVHNAAI